MKSIHERLMEGVDLSKDPTFVEEFFGEALTTPNSRGWSITVGDLRRALEGIPDDYEVMLTNADVVDTDISNINIDSLYRPYANSPGLLILGGGQVVNSEYAYHQRMDRGFAGDDRSARWVEQRPYAAEPQGDWKVDEDA